MSLARSVHFWLMLLVSVVLLERCHLTMQDSATSEKKSGNMDDGRFCQSRQYKPHLKTT